MRMRVLRENLRVEMENELRVFLENLNFEIEMRVSQKSAIRKFKLLKRQCCCNYLVSSQSIKKVNGRENVIIDQIWSVPTKLLPPNE